MATAENGKIQYESGILSPIPHTDQGDHKDFAVLTIYGATKPDISRLYARMVWPPAESLQRRQAEQKRRWMSQL